MFTEIPSEKNARWVAVLVHGLNLGPDRMRPLATVLSQNGAHVFNVHLTGADSYKDFKSVTADEWREDVDKALKAAFGMGAPVALLGFSLGGLLHIDHLARGGERPEYLGLICPAVQVRRWTHLARALFPLPKLPVPSASDRRYINHRFTPVAAYKALFDIHDDVHEALKVKEPSLLFPERGRVVLAEKDELVDTKKVKQFFQNHDLTYPVNVYPSDRPEKKTRLNHLMIDPNSLGLYWDRLIADLKQDLQI